MHKCRAPDHPHCTVWVMPGDAACAHGHLQPAVPSPVPASPELFAQDCSLAQDGIPSPLPRMRPHLRVSGFDPRAAGGRQSVKLELRGMPADAAPELTLVLKSALTLHDGGRHAVTRTRQGNWRPIFIEFSSRGVEHGQHRIEVALNDPQDKRCWECTLVILVPRPDATLAEIQQAFLATCKNVRVSAEDGSIARLHAPAGERLDIEVSARDASIAQLNLAPEPGKIDVGFATIAWDEELVEIDTAQRAAMHPCPASSACLVTPAGAGLPRYIRLFALDEFVLGRRETARPQADVLLAHFSGAGLDEAGLTRRLSASHAVIRRGRAGFEIEDISRFGLLIDGAWPGKHVPVPLSPGMHIELTASIRGVAQLVVAALLPHGVVLQRADHGAAAECFYLLEPERSPDPGRAVCHAADAGPALPTLFHRDAGFWHLDVATGRETAIAPTVELGPGSALPAGFKFTAHAYPDLERQRAGERRQEPHRLPGT